MDRLYQNWYARFNCQPLPESTMVTASKSARSEDAMRALAVEHFPR